MAEIFKLNEPKKYYYTGTYKQITLFPGLYKIECYGASGGGGNGSNSSTYAGYGGYTSGKIKIKEELDIYMYIGGAGEHAVVCKGGWNGGGSADNVRSSSGSGGGATDIRLEYGTWNNVTSLRSRIMVAGGGGGGARYNAKGGDGGGLTGINGNGASGGGQTYGGSSYGKFGIGGSGPTTNYGKGCGGGGYYGGGVNPNGNSYYHSGGGGSSFISGMEGCNAINSNGAHTGQSIHYSGLYFTECETKSGVNIGDGYVLITLLKQNTSVISYTYDDGIQNVNINPEAYYLGDTVTLTPIMKQGYLWDKWTGDIESLNEILSINIDKEGIISVHANSKPGPTQYTVKHYTQNIDIDNYTLQDTEIFEGITNDIAYPNTKIYKGFTEPEMQYITIKNDGTSILNYYYTRNKYTAIVISNGYTNKSEYYFEEKGTITYDDTLDIIYQCTGWKTNPKINVIKNGLKTYEFYMPASNVEFYILYMLRRLNSNIYKNIFPEEIFDMDFINKSLANIVISTEDIKQNNHDLSINDFVYLDDDGLYKKAIAEESIKANVVGIVSKIAGPNVFTLMDSGKIAFEHLDYTDTTILYLSDKIPGKAVHYSEITNTVYIPVAIYIENNIIIHLQQGSIGDVLAPYEEEEQSFEIYTQQELNDVVNQITNGVK